MGCGTAPGDLVKAKLVSLAIPSMNWAWHSSAPACCYNEMVNLKSLHFWLLSFKICLTSNNFKFKGVKKNKIAALLKE